MTLEEQLQMATSTTTAEVQTMSVPTNTPVQTTQTVAQPAAPMAQQAPVQTTVTTQAPPVQMASVSELQPIQQAPVQAPQIDVNNGVQTIQLGQQVNVKPLNLLRKLGVGEKIRFTILPGDVHFIKYHYTENMGKFACFSTDDHLGRCCIENGNYKHKFCLPILVYPTMPNDPKVIIPNARAELRILSLWDDTTYNVIVEAVTRNPGTPVDFVATATDTYGRLDVREDVGVSYANQFNQSIQEAINTYNIYKATVPALIRKNMDEATYANASRVNNQVNNNPANYNNRGGYQNYNGVI